jgi:predicted N-acetyltransferase YhbS
MTVEFRLADANELAAVFELRARAFNRGTPSDWAANVEQDPWRDAGADLVAVTEGRVVATVRVLARRIAGLDSELRLAGFGDVASDPAVRGQGHVRCLLGLAHERNRSAGYDLAMLFTRSPWVYSGSAGFSIVPHSWFELDLRRLPVPACHWTIEPADPSRHLAAIRRVYEQFGQGRPGYPLRGDEYWAHPARQTDASWTRVALDRDKEVAAYLRVRLLPDGRALVQEFPYIVGDAAFALAADLSQDPLMAQCASVGGLMPHDHVLGCAGAWSMSDSTMFHPYTAAGTQLLAALRDPTNERAVFWSGDSF